LITHDQTAFALPLLVALTVLFVLGATAIAAAPR
jgi:hypothetical protein